MSDLPITSFLTRTLQNNSRVKTNYSQVKANYLQVLVDMCREIFDYLQVRLKLELSGTVAMHTNYFSTVKHLILQCLSMF